MTTEAQEKIILAQMKAKQKPPTTQQLSVGRLSRIWDKIPQPTEEEIRKREEEEARVEIIRRQNMVREGLVKAGIPKGSRFYESSLDSYRTKTREQENAVSLCRDAVTRFDRGDGVILFGPPGTGKTHLLAGMLRESIKNCMTARYMTLTDFFALMRGCIAKGKADLDYIEELAKVQVLAIDDIYSIAQAKSDSEQSYQYEKIWHLLDKRYLYGHATISATNKDLNGFKKMLDERTIRRFNATSILVPKAG